MSRPARGAWVEMSCRFAHPEGSGRAPQGARGLKFDEVSLFHRENRRAPQGARGLKYFGYTNDPTALFVAPRKGRVG